MNKRVVDVVVISDVHLGTYGCRARELVDYLKSINTNILILNGDIIDGWQFSKSFFPASHMAVIKEILNLMMNGTRVFYITGNHDELLRRYSDFNLGNFALTDKLVLEIDNKMTWIFHGDVFDNTTKGTARFLARLGSNGYGILILVNRMLNFILKICGRDRISLSKKLMASVNRAVSKVNDLEMIAADLAIEKKYDYVICGHIHQPEKKEITTRFGTVTYLNSGDWVEHLTALEYAKNEWSIYKYDEQNVPAETDRNTESPLTVFTDKIDLHINSLTSE